MQHGYLDDADVALLLRRLEHVPIATAVRLPSADPAPIGRVLDAGADAVFIAMIESAEAGRSGGGRHQVCPYRCAQLRSATGKPRSRSRRAGSQSRVCSRWSRPRRASLALDEICAVDGLAGIYVGPADLAISMGYTCRAWTEACGPRRDDACSGDRHRGGSGHRHPRRDRQDRKGHGYRGFG